MAKAWFSINHYLSTTFYICLLSFSEHYPETLKHLYIINVGKIMKLLIRISHVSYRTLIQMYIIYGFIYGFIQRFGNSPLKRNISLIGGSQWKKVLPSVVPLNVLPPAWGGTNTGWVVDGKDSFIFFNS